MANGKWQTKKRAADSRRPMLICFFFFLHQRSSAFISGFRSSAI
jgi:hypothetical protein